MRFLAGMAAGFAQGMNQELDENRNEKREWRKTLFNHYVNDVVPAYQKYKLAGVERARNAEYMGALLNNSELGKAAAMLGVKDPKGIASLFQVGGSGTHLTSEAQDAVGGGSGDDQLQGGTSPAMQQAAQTFAGRGGEALVPNKFNEQEPSFWDRMMGKPNLGALSREAAGIAGGLYGINPDELQGMGRQLMNPESLIPRMPIDPSKLPARRDGTREKMVASMMQDAKFANDPVTFRKHLLDYQAGNDNALVEAQKLVPGWEDRQKKIASLRAKAGGDGGMKPSQLLTMETLQTLNILKQRAYARIKEKNPTIDEATARQQAQLVAMQEMNRYNALQGMVNAAAGGAAPNVTQVLPGEDE